MSHQLHVHNLVKQQEVAPLSAYFCESNITPYRGNIDYILNLLCKYCEEFSSSAYLDLCHDLQKQKEN